MQTNSRPACYSYPDIYPDPSNNLGFILIFGCLYAFVFLLGLAGNMCIIYATLRHRTLQTVQNIFIVNLGVSDVILCLLSIPLTPVTHISKQWFFGSFLCRILSAIQGIGVFIGTFSLCAIAVDRYFRLVLSPSQPLGKRHAIRITIMLWLISILVTLPYVYHMKMRTYEGICGQFCTEKWPNVQSKRLYTFFVLIIQFVIPFTIMTICYHSIFSFLRQRAYTRIISIQQQANLLYVLAATVGGDTQQHQDQVVIFGATALPHNISSLLTEFEDENSPLFTIDGRDYTYLVNIVTHFLAMTSCVTNPILYAFLNPEFRELLLKGIKCAPMFASRSFAPTQTSYF